ncbi:MAG: hypothetical protein VB071_11360 [Lawsonibacter sp.]|nr:hypothetical protein [Lawsonibacter sp.]
MSNKKIRGRKMQSDQVQVTPEFREKPDIKKLVLALIAIAKTLDDKKAKQLTKNEENDMT